MAQSEAELAALPQDILLTRLAKYTKDGGFTGEYARPGRTEIEENFERNLAQIYERADTPRLSGVRIKAPMYLDPGGSLSPATGTPFTHILKPAGTGGYDALPVVEWTAMALGRAAGFLAPATALVAIPDGMRPALVVERLDVRESKSDTNTRLLRWKTSAPYSNCQPKTNTRARWSGLPRCSVTLNGIRRGPAYRR